MNNFERKRCLWGWSICSAEGWSIWFAERWSIYSRFPPMQDNHVDFLIGGASYCSPITEIEEPFFKIREFSGTHIIMFFKSMYDLFLNSDITIDYDAFLSEKLMTKKLNGFALYPFVASTLNSFSDIRKSVVDDSKFYSNFIYK